MRVSTKFLDTHYPKDIVGMLFRDMENFMDKIKRTPSDYSIGVKVILAYMKMDLCLYKAMLKNNIKAETAQNQIEEISWGLYKSISVFSYKITRLIGRDQKRRLRSINGLLWLLVFRKPFKRIKANDESHAGFDVIKCPLAEFFQENEASELTPFAACNLDFPLARIWQSELTRNHTIARGNDLCDFRFFLYQNRKEIK